MNYIIKNKNIFIVSIVVLFIFIFGYVYLNINNKNIITDKPPTNSDMTKAVINGIILLNGLDVNNDKTGMLKKELKSIVVKKDACKKILPFNYRCSFLFAMKNINPQKGQAYFTEMKQGSWKATMVLN